MVWRTCTVRSAAEFELLLCSSCHVVCLLASLGTWM